MWHFISIYIHFKFILAYGVNCWSESNFCQSIVQFSQEFIYKIVSSSPSNWGLCVYQTLYYCVSFSMLYHLMFSIDRPQFFFNQYKVMLMICIYCRLISIVSDLVLIDPFLPLFSLLLRFLLLLQVSPVWSETFNR